MRYDEKISNSGKAFNVNVFCTTIERAQMQLRQRLESQEMLTTTFQILFPKS